MGLLRGVFHVEHGGWGANPTGIKIGGGGKLLI